MVSKTSEPIRATLSGSFHRDTEGMNRSYRELIRNQCQVLSPRRLDFINPSALFVKHRVEESDDEMTIEKHHLQAIEQSDFLWIHAPEGYIGVSTALEIGFAYAHRIPIFAQELPDDVTLKHFIRKVPSVFSAIEQLG